MNKYAASDDHIFDDEPDNNGPHDKDPNDDELDNKGLGDNGLNGNGHTTTCGHQSCSGILTVPKYQKQGFNSIKLQQCYRTLCPNSSFL